MIYFILILSFLNAKLPNDVRWVVASDEYHALTTSRLLAVFTSNMPFLNNYAQTHSKRLRNH